MREISISSTLIVHHDGRFRIGVSERTERDQPSAVRIAFGAERREERYRRRAELRELRRRGR